MLRRRRREAGLLPGDDGGLQRQRDGLHRLRDVGHRVLRRRGVLGGRVRPRDEPLQSRDGLQRRLRGDRRGVLRGVDVRGWRLLRSDVVAVRRERRHVRQRVPVPERDMLVRRGGQLVLRGGDSVCERGVLRSHDERVHRQRRRVRRVRHHLLRVGVQVLRERRRHLLFREDVQRRLLRHRREVRGERDGVPRSIDDL
jgi:hypothetical protein